MSYQYALGIDLNKNKSTWKLLDSNRSVIWSKNVMCQPESLELAIKQLPVNPVNLPVAIEPTCGWRWVSRLLEKNNCDVHIANPYKLRLIAESKKKTDEEDAKTLAEFLLIGYLPESYMVTDEIEEWRQLVRTRVSIVEARTKIKNQINSLLTATRPISKKQSLPDDLKIQELASLIKEQTIHIQTLEKEIKKIVMADPVCQLLLPIPAVGVVTALSIVAEVGDFSRFKSADKLASYAGLVPSQRSSGESIRYGHIVKTGSKLLRTTLVETAMRFRPKYDTRLNTWFERVKKDRGAMRARTALAHKLLTIMWSMVKNNQPFVSSCDTVKSGNLV